MLFPLQAVAEYSWCSIWK